MYIKKRSTIIAQVSHKGRKNAKTSHFSLEFLTKSAGEPQFLTMLASEFSHYYASNYAVIEAAAADAPHAGVPEIMVILAAFVGISCRAG